MIKRPYYLQRVILGLRDGHFAVAAVEAEGEALAVVEEEKRFAGLCSMIFRAHAELVSDAVSCPHELS
jgi:hypothetical protein